jgi:hypothetical protein
MMRAAMLFLALIELPGTLLCLATQKRGLTLLELAVLPTSLGLLFAPTVALVLMSVDAFDLRHQVIAQALVLLPLAVFVVRRRRLHLNVSALWAEARTHRREHTALLALVLVVVAWTRPASEWVLAETMDAGNYVIQAAYQARHRSLFFTDAQPDVYALDFPGASWRMNSTSGTPVEPQRRQFPFPPFFRTLLALMLSIGGLPLLLYTPLLLGVLAALCAYLTLRATLQTPFPALLGTALLLGSPLLVQFMRVPLAEVCFLFATLLALALLALARDAESRTAGILAGLALALGLLIRADGLLVYAGGVIAIAAGLVPGARSVLRGVTRSFAGAFLFGSAAAWALAVRATSVYLDHHLRGGLTAVSVGTVIVALLGTAAWAPNAGWLRRVARVAARLMVGGVAAWAFVVLVGQPLRDATQTLACVLAALAGRPGPGVGQGLASLAYLTLPTVLLGIYGLALVALEGEAEALFWATLFALGAALFLYAPFHMPDAYWTSRRSLGHLLPLLVMGSAHALRRLTARGSGLLRSVMASFIGLSLIGHNAVITYQNGIHYQGAAASLKALAEHFAARDVVLVDGRVPLAAALQLGLRYLHDRESLAPQLDSVTDLQLAAYWSKLHAAGRGLHVLTDSTLAENRLARCFDLQPTSLSLAYHDWVHGQLRPVQRAYVSYALTRARQGCSLQALGASP